MVSQFIFNDDSRPQSAAPASIKRRQRRGRRAAALLAAAIAIAPGLPASAQVAAPGGIGGGPAAGAPAAPASPEGPGASAAAPAAGAVGAPAVTSGISSAGGAPGVGLPGAATPGIGGPTPLVLSLAQVVNTVLNNNTAVIEAKQRLQESQEQITQVDAQNRPQIRIDAANTYNSFAATSNDFGPTVQNPLLPSGSAIPTITDQAAQQAESLSAISSPISGLIAPGIATGTGTAGFGVPGPGGAGGNPGVGAGSSTPAAPADTGMSTPAVPAGGIPSSSPSGAATPSAPAPAIAAPAPVTGTVTPGLGGGAAPGAAPSTNGSGAGTTGSGAAGSGSTMALPPPSSQPTQVAMMPSAYQPNVQAMPMPSILQDFLSATDGGGYVISDEDPSKPAAAPREAVPDTYFAKPAAANAKATPDAPPAATTASAIPGTIAHRDVYGARISASQYIDLFGYVPAARQAEQAIRDFYTLDLQRTEDETALAAKSTYFNVLLAQDEVSVQQEQVTYATENVRITTARKQQGIAADYDVLTAQTAPANAQELLSAAQNQLQLADSQLSFLLGVNPDTPISLQEPALPPLDETTNLTQSIAVAEQRRPELQQASRNVFVANRLVKLAHDTQSPTLGIVGVAEYDNVASEFAPQNLGYISAQLGFPLSDGGATRSRVREAQVALQTQLVTRSSLQLSVSLEVRQASLNITNAQVEIKTAQYGVRQAEEAVRLANLRYTNGLGTFLDVTNALAQLSTARSNLSTADFAYQTSLAALVRDVGGR